VNAEVPQSPQGARQMQGVAGLGNAYVQSKIPDPTQTMAEGVLAAFSQPTQLSALKFDQVSYREQPISEAEQAAGLMSAWVDAIQAPNRSTIINLGNQLTDIGFFHALAMHHDQHEHSDAVERALLEAWGPMLRGTTLPLIHDPQKWSRNYPHQELNQDPEAFAVLHQLTPMGSGLDAETLVNFLDLVDQLYTGNSPDSQSSPDTATQNTGNAQQPDRLAIREAWAAASQTPDRAHIHALARLLTLAGMAACHITPTTKNRQSLMMTYVVPRILSPTAHGLTWPTGFSLTTHAHQPNGTPTVLRDNPQHNATVLAELLAKTRLTAHEIAACHELIALVYENTITDEEWSANLPSTQREAHRKLQSAVIFCNQRDNISEMESSSRGGTCSLSAVAMAMQAAGIVPLEHIDGVTLAGLDFDQRLLSIAQMRGRTQFTHVETWSWLVGLHGGQMRAIFHGGLVPTETWTQIQEDHLDQGHGVVVSIRGHVVRLQRVPNHNESEAEATSESDQFVVDDPYGASVLRSSLTHMETLTVSLKDEQTGAESSQTLFGISQGTTKPPLVLDDSQQALEPWTPPEETQIVSVQVEQKSRHYPFSERKADQLSAREFPGEDHTWEPSRTNDHYMNGIWAITKR